jgi:uncharacterized membrane protein
MTASAPRSIDEYLKQLRDALSGEDPALIQDALYDAEEYLRAEIAANPGKSEADVLELIASTYGAPDEVATAYRDTEAKVKAALQPPQPRRAESPDKTRRFFSVFSDSRAYTSLFYMLLSLATGIVYFTFVVTGVSLSFGLALLIIGLPFFLIFIGMARVISLGEGRLLEAVTGERMPRRPVHPGPKLTFFARIGAMLTDSRTWTTLAYFLLMMPLGIVYFVIATVGLSLGVSFIVGPVLEALRRMGVFGDAWGAQSFNVEPHWLNNPVSFVLLMIAGVLILTVVLHLARGIGRIHVRLAKSLLVTPG